LNNPSCVCLFFKSFWEHFSHW